MQQHAFAQVSGHRMTFQDWIDKIGVETLADRTGHRVGTVRVWRHRNRIPRGVWPDLILAFPGLTVTRLVRMDRAS